nr:MAG TPA: hypothetical protein [Caudoviricetes sp.]
MHYICFLYMRNRMGVLRFTGNTYQTICKMSIHAHIAMPRLCILGVIWIFCLLLRTSQQVYD